MSNTLGLRGRKQAWAGEQGSGEQSKVSAHAQMTGILGVGRCKMGKGRDGKLCEREQDVYRCTRLRAIIVSSPGDIASFCI